MVRIHQLRKRRKDAFLKEAAKLSNEYVKRINNIVSSNFTRYANDCFNLVEKYSCDYVNLKCECGKESVGFFGSNGEIQRPVCGKCLKELEKEAIK